MLIHLFFISNIYLWTNHFHFPLSFIFLFFLYNKKGRKKSKLIIGW